MVVYLIRSVPIENFFISGVNRTREGEAVYGPVSSLVKLLTAPKSLEPPSNLAGTPVSQIAVAIATQFVTMETHSPSIIF